MGKEDARRGCVSWLVEPLYGNRLARLVQSTHHQGAQALATTHRLSLAALVTPVAWSVATMHTALARSEFASCRTRRVGANLVRRVHRLWCPVLQKHLMPRTVLFFKPSSSFREVGSQRVTDVCSDWPGTPGRIMNAARFQQPLPEPCMRLITAHGSPGLCFIFPGLLHHPVHHRYLPCT